MTGQPEQEQTITVELTISQARELAELAAYGIEEKEYDIEENDPYTEEETRDVLAGIEVAKTAIDVVQAKLQPHFAELWVARQREQDGANHA